MKYRELLVSELIQKRVHSSRGLARNTGWHFSGLVSSVAIRYNYSGVTKKFPCEKL